MTFRVEDCDNMETSPIYTNSYVCTYYPAMSTLLFVDMIRNLYINVGKFMLVFQI
jgi:hypothetical protein